MDIRFFLTTLERQIKDLLEDFPELQQESEAFVIWSLINLLDVAEEEAVECIVEGGDDKGIDAIYVPDQGGKLLVLQAKRLGNPDRNFPATDIVKLLNGIDWLLSGNLSQAKNERFKAKAEEFREAFVSAFPPVDICTVGTCLPPADDGLQEIKKFMDKYNSLQEIFSFEAFDLQKMFGVYRRNLSRTPPNRIEIDLCDAPYEHSVGGVNSVTGSVKGATLARMFEEYGNSIFETNIRNYLGNVKINRGIRQTSRNPAEAHNFWFYNNGVTFVCDELSWRSIKEQSRVQLLNAQIVNGCQTVHSLYRANLDGGLRNEVEILVRIIEKPDPDFVKQVTLSTNSQNAVKASDLVGTDEVQLQLRDDFERMGFFYETRRGDFKASYPDRASRIRAFGPDYADKVIRLSEAAQACASFYLQIPVTAKKNTTYLFFSKVEGGYYEDVFVRDTTPEKILGAVMLMRAITRQRKSPPDYLSHIDISWLPHGDHFLCALFYHRFFSPESLNNPQYVESFFKWFDDRFDDNYRDTVTTVSAYISKISTQEDYNHPKFFKSEKGYIRLAGLFDESKIFKPNQNKRN